MRIALLSSLLLPLAIGCATTSAQRSVTTDALQCEPSPTVAARENPRDSQDPSAPYLSPLPVMRPGPSVQVESSKGKPQASLTNRDPACVPVTTETDAKAP